MSVLSELQRVTRILPTQDEDDADYVRRLAQGVGKLPDSEWKKLSDPAQVWANSVLEAMHKGEPVPGLPEKLKPKPASKGAKVKKEKKPDTRPIMTTGKIDRRSVIRIKVSENPHEKGTRAWWAFSYYRDGMTVQEAYNRCVGWTNIVWDQSNGYIELE